ncbi:MAG: glycosyltransferase family 2 protein, partial [Planctomycetota bacterium]
MAAPISIVIPNYNGARLLGRHLPGVLDALSAYLPGGELIVVDDGSTDASVSWLREHAREATLVVHEKNQGFQAACTTGIEAARHELLLLLNTDVEVTPGFIDPLIRSLAPDDVFAAGCLALDETGNAVTENLKIPYLRSGSIKFAKLKGSTLESCRAVVPCALPTLFATGGFMAMKRSLFFALGGFDPLFEPFYYEDADLCFRAWKQGYRVL